MAAGAFLRPYRRDGWTTRQTGTIEIAYPRNADSVAAGVGTGAAAWAWSAYVQISASTAADFLPHAVHIMILPRPRTSVFFNSNYEIEVAKGAAAAEVAIATFGGGFGAETPEFVSSASILGTSFTVPISSDLIPSGTRLSFRVRHSVAGTTATFSARIYLTGYDTDAPVSDRTYPLDEQLRGLHNDVLKLTPSGSTTAVTAGAAWGTYGSWVEFIASAANPLLVWGVSYGDAASISQVGQYTEVGIGAAGAEVTYARLALPGLGLLNSGCQFLRRPLLVLAGERVTLRSTCGTPVAIPHQLMTSDLAP